MSDETFSAMTLSQFQSVGPHHVSLSLHTLGRRRFQKRLFCNWTGGYKWSTALALRYPPPHVEAGWSCDAVS